MSEDTEPRITDRRLWERVLYMLFCAIAYSVAEFVVAVLAIFQVACVALTGSINERAQQLGQNVGAYIRELIAFATFNSERVPFPFSDWPEEAPGDSPWAPTRPTPAPARAPAEPSAAPTEPAPSEPEAGPTAPRPSDDAEGKGPSGPDTTGR